MRKPSVRDDPKNDTANAAAAAAGWLPSGGALTPGDVYAAVGGDENGGPEAFAALADAFYAGVEADPLLRPMYSEGDLAEARENLALFLMQYFGGPAVYAEKRGHPRLRMRHLPFVIGAAERDAWLRHMDAALGAVPAFAPVAPVLRRYFGDAARFLQNRPG
jgi:hemoglobin